ncbi:MAG: YraN family protein [Rikenellaceae bacterium]
MNHNARIGVEGEKAATKWLRKNGFLIRDLNWRHGKSEIDIIAIKQGATHFIEVKTRMASNSFRPEHAITKDKVGALMRGAKSYIAQFGLTGEFKFDLIAVDVEDSGEYTVRYLPNGMPTDKRNVQQYNRYR